MSRATAEIKGKDLVIHLSEPLNMDHIETVAGQTDRFWVDYDVADTRQVRPQQRRLFFALLNDIITQFDVPKDFLKDMFYTQYSIFTDGKEISLANGSDCSVSDANELLDLVVDFMFEYHVPFKAGYELLPRDQEYFLFECCRHRVCCICGKRAQIHHVTGDKIGIGGDRTKVDHTKRHVLPLCAVHHELIHNITEKEFGRRYHMPVTGIKLDAGTLKRIGVQGDYSEAK
ncbi:putative HNHc nuclease [Lactobacillus acetotolerans]|uniref:putative HNHc nuclease n=1 Tax=Lactobacillus acetotolerans TaxID=1600 RepID=UPI002FDB4A10